MNQIKIAKISYAVISVLMAILGMFLIIFPKMGINLLCYLLGAAILTFGIVKIIGYFSKDLFRLAFQFDLALGVLIGILGLLIIIHPYKIADTVPYIIGVCWIIDGALKVQTAIDSKRFGMKNWWLILALAIITCICGTLLIIDPFDGAVALAIMLGVSLICDGMQNLCTVIYTVKSDRKKNVKIIDIED